MLRWQECRLVLALTRFEREDGVNFEMTIALTGKSSCNYMRDGVDILQEPKSILRTSVHLVLNRYMGLGARSGLVTVPMMERSTAKNVIEYY